MIIDATDLILGRLATKAAKAALLGETVTVVNCENAVVTGTKEVVLAKYKRKRSMGTPAKGPFFPRLPDRFVRRTIRGMLPYKKGKGSDAYKRVMCYISVPDEFKNEKLESFEDSNISKLPNIKFMTVKEICRLLGAKL